MTTPKRSEPAADEWLLVEWPEGAAEPDHYWFSTLPADISFERLVDQTKLRWRIERDYLELKQEVGLGHYEGRGWRGFHHHASLCIAAYGSLVSEKETIPPSGPGHAWRGSQSALPAGYRPRRSAAALPTPHAENCPATIKMDVVLPHPAMLPNGPSIASSGCSRRHITLSIGAQSDLVFGCIASGFVVEPWGCRRTTRCLLGTGPHHRARSSASPPVPPG